MSLDQHSLTELIAYTHSINIHATQGIIRQCYLRHSAAANDLFDNQGINLKYLLSTTRTQKYSGLSQSALCHPHIDSRTGYGQSAVHAEGGYTCMTWDATHHTFTGVGARQYSAASGVCAPPDEAVAVMAVGDGRLGSITVHSRQSHR